MQTRKQTERMGFMKSEPAILDAYVIPLVCSIGTRLCITCTELVLRVTWSISVVISACYPPGTELRRWSADRFSVSFRVV